MDHALTASVGVAQNDQHITTGRCQRGDFSGIVRFVVFVRCGKCDGATSSFERSDKAVGQAFAVVAVLVRNGNGSHAIGVQNARQNFTLTCVRRRGAEEQAVVFDGRQARRCRRGRDHRNAVRQGNVGQDRAGDTGAVRAHDGDNAVSCDQTLGRCGTSRRVATGRVTANRNQRHAVQKLTAFVDFFNCEFGGIRHGGRQRFNRAGKAQNHTDFRFGGMACGESTTCVKRANCSGQQHFFHDILPVRI